MLIRILLHAGSNDGILMAFLMRSTYALLNELGEESFNFQTRRWWFTSIVSYSIRLCPIIRALTLVAVRSHPLRLGQLSSWLSLVAAASRGCCLAGCPASQLPQLSVHNQLKLPDNAHQTSIAQTSSTFDSRDDTGDHWASNMACPHIGPASMHIIRLHFQTRS